MVKEKINVQFIHRLAFDYKTYEDFKKIDIDSFNNSTSEEEGVDLSKSCLKIFKYFPFLLSYLCSFSD